MNRRSLLRFFGLVPLATATDSQAWCKIFGHKWEFTHNSPLEEKDFVDGKGAGWWWEWFTCRRCGAVARELVASPRG